MSRTVYEVPLSANPQAFAISLAGVTYGLTVRWNAAAASWTLSIADANGNPILGGLPLVTGADLLGQYGYLGIGGSLVVQTDHDTDALPTIDNLGAESHLYFVVKS